MVQSPKQSRLRFATDFAPDLPDWSMENGGGSRLIRRDAYPQADTYHSLATVYTPDGAPLGDAVAEVQPGGTLGSGRILYVAGDLLQYPDRTGLLDALLRRIPAAFRRTPDQPGK